VCELVKGLGARILDGPDEFPYEGPGGWYAVYFLGPDRMKFEVVHMPAAENTYHELTRILERGATLGALKADPLLPRKNARRPRPGRARFQERGSN